MRSRNLSLLIRRTLGARRSELRHLVQIHEQFDDAFGAVGEAAGEVAAALKRRRRFRAFTAGLARTRTKRGKKGSVVESVLTGC